MRKIKQCFFLRRKKKKKRALITRCHRYVALAVVGWQRDHMLSYARLCVCVCVLFNNCVHFNIRGITAGILCPNPIFKNCHLSVHFCVGIETVLRILSTTNFRQTNCHLSRCF